MTFPSVTQREALADVRQRTRDLRTRLRQAREARDSARHEFANSSHDNGDVTHSPEFVRAERAVAEVNRIQADLALAEAEERDLLGVLGNGNGSGLVTSGDSFLSDRAVLEDLGQRAHGPKPVGDLNLGTLISREAWIARHGQAAAADWRITGDGWGGSRMAVSELDTVNTADSRSRFIGVTRQLRRPLTLLDVMPTQPMDTGSFDYEREEGNLATAAETAEGALAPAADIVLTPATCTARSITHYLKARREQLDDMNALATTFNVRLPYGVQLRLENQVLDGTGTGENLLGILRVSGIGAPASGAGDSHNTDLVANGIGTVLSAGAVPTGVVLNPLDAIAMVKAKTGAGGDRLDSEGAFASALLSQLWGVPAILNLGMPSKVALVGDFTMGCTLFVREGVSVRTSDSDQDDFLRRRVTFLASGRYGLAVWQSACFAKVILSFPV